MSTLKEIRRIQKLAAGQATMEDIDAQNAKPIQHTTNAQRNAAQPSKLQQLIDAVSSKRGISTGVGAGVGGATGYSVGAATGMSPKAKMLATILGAAAGGTAGNLFAKQSNSTLVKKADNPIDTDAEYGVYSSDPNQTYNTGYRGARYLGDAINKAVGGLRSSIEGHDAALSRIADTGTATALGSLTGAGAGLGGAMAFKGSNSAKLLATILGAAAGGTAGNLFAK